MSSNTNSKRQCIDLVLGGGGMKGVAHIGLVQYLREQRVCIGSVTGVSAGSVVAGMVANDLSVDEMLHVFGDEFSFARPARLARALLPPVNPLRWVAGGFIDPLPSMRALVRNHELQPRANLNIVAYDLLTRQPFSFGGKQYDLAEAMSASCAVPGVLHAVSTNIEGQRRLLVDGGVWHPHPSHFSRPSALVARLMHGGAIDVFFKNRRRDIVLPLGDPSIKVFCRLSAPRAADGVEHGYRLARALLQRHIDSGQIPTAA